MHWFLIIASVAVILILQGRRFHDTRKKIKQFLGIFPSKCSENFYIYNSSIVSSSSNEENIKRKQNLEKELKYAEDEIEKLESLESEICEKLNGIVYYDDYNDLDIQRQNLVDQLAKLKDERNKLKRKIKSFDDTPIYIKSGNAIQDTIMESINDYLSKNKNTTSDFTLIKDIVDRNSDAAEDEIQSQIPMPLYLGLMGTMIGILVGIGYLVVSGDLSGLLSSGNGNSASTDGITALMGGVALAMIASICGIILTTIGTKKLKDAKSSVEKNKHGFLTWMQTELLPVMSSDTAAALTKMTTNLASFNTAFSENTKDFKEILSQVKEATQGQAETLKLLKDLNVKKISTANIETYEKLKNCTQEIGNLAELLENSTSYLKQVRLLSQRIDKEQALRQLVQEMIQYYKTTKDAVSGTISQTIGNAEERLGEATRVFGDNITRQYRELTVSTSETTNILKETIREQNEALQHRVKEFETLTAEIKNITSVKSSMDKLEKATSEQNKKIDALAKSIEKLATQKAEGHVVSHSDRPRWQTITAVVCGGIIALACLCFVVISIMGWVAAL